MEAMMQGGSDEQSWWATLLNGGVDAGLAVPDEVWDSAVRAALDPETPPPPEDIVPSPEAELDPDDEQADAHTGAHDAIAHWVLADDPVDLNDDSDAEGHPSHDAAAHPPSAGDTDGSGSGGGIDDRADWDYFGDVGDGDGLD
jgi:hypothetical protein